MKYERAIIFAAGALLGTGIAVAAYNGCAKKACVKLVKKGLELKECAANVVEQAKENVEDIVAEAKA